jgi:nucleoside-diphosphate-sugar epimerase
MAERAFVTGGSGFIGGALIRRLVGDGHEVRALARSGRSAQKVSELGAEPVRGDLSRQASLASAAEGCELAFHAAAEVEEWGPWEDFVRGNVLGTLNALGGCREAGVRRFVHVGTEAALLAGQPLVNADETTELRPDSPAPYPATKAMADRLVRRFEGMETVVVRPRLVWGPGDTTVLPGLLDAVRSGQFAWIGGGRHKTSTTHVDNVIEGLVLGAREGRHGEAYFVTDGEPLVFRDFVTRLLATQGEEPGDNEVPRFVAAAVARGGEALWRTLPLSGAPPVTRLALWLTSLECTIDTTKAQTELGYRPVVSVEEGLAGLSRASVGSGS